ncbi:hypothetical protein HDV00_006057 [Rhizophlyctis rosea]|nr:hypothetical protein HDV00_006057 [Rhizophlyctis rosea]
MKLTKSLHSQQVSLLTLPDALRFKIYDAFLSTSPPPSFLPFRATCKDFSTHLRTYLTHTYIPNLYLDLTFTQDWVPGVDTQTYLTTLYEYTIPKLGHHYERCRTTEQRREDFKTGLENMMDEGEWEPETTIDTFIADQDLTDWVNVVTAVPDPYPDTFGPNRQLWDAIFGRWVDIDGFGDPECLDEDGWQLKWRLYPHVDGNKIIFQCHDSIIPFGFGWRSVFVDLTAHLSEWSRFPIIHGKQFIFNEPERGFQNVDDDSDEEETEGDIEYTEVFSGWKAFPAISPIGEDMGYSIEDEPEEEEKETKEAARPEHKGKGKMPESISTIAGPSGSANTTIKHPQPLRCSLHRNVTPHNSTLTFHHIQKDLHYLTLHILHHLVRTYHIQHPPPPPPALPKQPKKARKRPKPRTKKHNWSTVKRQGRK